MTILFYPDPLDNYEHYSRVLRILEKCDWVTFHNNPLKPYDLHIFWSYMRNKITPPALTLKDKIVLNRGCWDISKVKVNRIFNDISIDPREHKGICVEKYDWQGGHHWHSIVECPIEPKPGYIYQKYIDDMEGDFYIRYRVFLMDGIITHVSKRYEKHRFETFIKGEPQTVKIENIAPSDFFTDDEMADILNKCHKFGVDFGELDILIDNDKKIILDVNNVVGGNSADIIRQSKTYKETNESFLNMLKKYK